MANDPGLANDTCIFLEAIKGDQGVHDGRRAWWLSPDIIVGGTSTPSGFVESGPAKVRIRRKPASSNCQFLGDESVTVQLWAAPPSLVIAPDVTDSAQLVQSIGSPMPAEGGSGTQEIDLAVATGPKTLVARGYSESVAPSSSNFFLPGDQHVVMRNLFLITTSSSQFPFKFNTLNPGSQLTPRQKVKLKAVLDLSPDTHVKNAVTGRIQSVSGLQLRTQPLPGGFNFDLTGFTATNVVDSLTPPPVLSARTSQAFEAEVAVPVRRVAQMVFSASLKKVAPGEACIFHLTQHSLNDQPQGGLTLLVRKQ